MHRDVMFLEDSPEFFQNSREIWDTNAVMFISILFFLGVSLSRGFGEKVRVLESFRTDEALWREDETP